MTRRVVITGMGGITAFGEDWPTISRRLREYENAVRTMTEWQAYDGLQTLLAAPIEDFTLPAHYTRKRIRAMGRVSLLSTRATELALEQAGLIDDAVLTNGQTGIAYGSSTGSTGPVSEFASMLTEKHTHNITGTTYLWQPGDWLRLGSDSSRLPDRDGGRRRGRAVPVGSGGFRYPVCHQPA
mgnify:CR=1 FL=1